WPTRARVRPSFRSTVRASRGAIDWPGHTTEGTSSVSAHSTPSRPGGAQGSGVEAPVPSVVGVVLPRPMVVVVVVEVAPASGVKWTAATASRSNPAVPPAPGWSWLASMRTKRADERPTVARSKLSPPEQLGGWNASAGPATSRGIGKVAGTRGAGAPDSSAFAKTGYTPAQPG